MVLRVEGINVSYLNPKVSFCNGVRTNSTNFSGFYKGRKIKRLILTLLILESTESTSNEKNKNHFGYRE